MELEKQINRVRNQMLLEGYSHSGIKIYDHCRNHLKIVANKSGLNCYSDKLAEGFLRSRKEKDNNYINNEKKYRRSLELIRWFLAEGNIAPPNFKVKRIVRFFPSYLK